MLMEPNYNKTVTLLSECDVRRMGSKMVTRVKDNNPFGTLNSRLVRAARET